MDANKSVSYRNSYYFIKQSRTVREFDSKLTAPMFGFKSAEDYYINYSPIKVIDRVRVPLLCLNAVDDPYVPFDCK